MSEVINQQEVETQVDSSESTEAREGSVAYETHKKVLAQRKRDQEENRALKERLDKFEAAERAKQQKELESKGEYEKILAERDNKIKQLLESQEEDKRRRVNNEKESAFIQSLPGKLKNPAYLQFMDKESIAIDPETGRVDQGTLKSVVDKFLKEHGSLLESKPNSAPVSNFGKAPSAPNAFINQKESVSPLQMAARMLTQK